MRVILVVIVLVLIAGAGVVFLVGPERIASRFSAEGRRARMLARLNNTDVVSRRSCGTGEAYVNAAKWQDLGSRDQERAAEALAAYCASQGGDGSMAIIDGNSYARLGRWNGTALER